MLNIAGKRLRLTMESFVVQKNPKFSLPPDQILGFSAKKTAPPEHPQWMIGRRPSRLVEHTGLEPVTS